MNIRKWIIEKLKPEGTALVEVEQIQCQHAEPTTMGGGQKEETELEIKEESTKKLKTKQKPKQKRKSKKSKKSNKRYNVEKVISGEHPGTTGLIRKLTNGKYDYYYYNPEVAPRNFKTYRKSVETLLKIQKEWLGCGCNPVMWKNILNKYPPKHPKGRNHYRRKDGRYSIKHYRVYFGSVPTKEQAKWIVAYLKYKKWDEKYRACNFSKTRLRGNSYYLHMKRIILEDEEYLKWSGQKK